MRLRAAPRHPPADDATGVLERAYRVHRLSVAGPLVPFDAPAALAAAGLVQHAAWYLLNPGAPIEQPECLRLPVAPTTAAQHLSADPVLRLLPILLRRARAGSSADVLPKALADVLRRWPLSGVLADLSDGPLTSLDLGGHPGLQLLYAERLARHERPGWFPAGAAAAHVELVWQQLGRDTTHLPHLQDLARSLAALPRKDDA
jgi:hypothetical protein